MFAKRTDLALEARELWQESRPLHRGSALDREGALNFFKAPSAYSAAFRKT